jgi:hypothetical protein
LQSLTAFCTKCFEKYGWFQGEVKHYLDNHYFVRYDDGDAEEYSENEMEGIAVFEESGNKPRRRLAVEEEKVKATLRTSSGRWSKKSNTDEAEVELNSAEIRSNSAPAVPNQLEQMSGSENNKTARSNCRGSLDENLAAVVDDESSNRVFKEKSVPKAFLKVAVSQDDDAKTVGMPKNAKRVDKRVRDTETEKQNDPSSSVRIEGSTAIKRARVESRVNRIQGGVKKKHTGPIKEECIKATPPLDSDVHENNATGLSAAYTKAGGDGVEKSPSGRRRSEDAEDLVADKIESKDAPVKIGTSSSWNRPRSNLAREKKAASSVFLGLKKEDGGQPYQVHSSTVVPKSDPKFEKRKKKVKRKYSVSTRVKKVRLGKRGVCTCLSRIIWILTTIYFAVLS